jgi:hypothetical protein
MKATIVLFCVSDACEYQCQWCLSVVNNLHSSHLKVKVEEVKSVSHLIELAVSVLTPPFAT